MRRKEELDKRHHELTNLLKKKDCAQASLPSVCVPLCGLFYAIDPARCCPSSALCVLQAITTLIRKKPIYEATCSLRVVGMLVMPEAIVVCVKVDHRSELKFRVMSTRLPLKLKLVQMNYEKVV